MQEKRLTAAEREERTALNCAHNADEARLKKDKETRKRIGGVLSDVDILLGKTLRVGSRFKKICYSLEKPRINIAGKAEALEAVQDLVDDALMVGVGSVTILHGKGTGALKEEIRRYLRTVPEVRSAVDEHADRGGAGITVVTFE